MLTLHRRPVWKYVFYNSDNFKILERKQVQYQKLFYFVITLKSVAKCNYNNFYTYFPINKPVTLR